MTNKKTFMVFIRSTIFWFLALGIIPFYLIMGYVLIIVNARIRHKALSTWGRAFTLLARYICGVKYTAIGQENLPNSPSLLVSNHQSTWETFAYVAILPQHIWILKRELIRLPFFGWTLRMASPIAIDRSNRSAATQQILRQSAERVAKGFSILVFPEGTRVAPGAIKSFKPGAARIALALNIPIVPIANNAGYCMPRSSYMLYPGTIEIIIDKPIYPKADETADQLTSRVEQVIRQNLAKMSR